VIADAAHRLWQSRWARAVVVAAAVAAWPACAAYSEAPEGDRAIANFSFTLKDMDGNDVRLADYKGRPLIINFWATWCAPCKHEIPAFVELVEKYKDANFTVLGVSVDDAPEDLKPFAREYGINYPLLVGLGQYEMQEAYEAGLIVPTSWFIRRDGTVHLKHTGTQTKDWFEAQVKAIVE
jgi:cytochrome c biogenesis protein CcmG/thiol:disulfide interchange protein DsbE